MVLQSNLDQIAKEIEAYKIEVKRKLENVVKHFVVDAIVASAIQINPLGDARKFANFYKRRQLATGLLPIEGFSKGSWQVSFSQSSEPQYNYAPDSGGKATELAKSKIENYELGQTVFVLNIGPYINVLQSGYNFLGRVPSMAETALKSNLQYYFDKG